ncbi:hypothetical protein [Roseovarius salis]|uniref:hypothetical protein n=1 Tax=Roseovarius salis TaxID=3376063 RepID=UPI0037C7053E
MRSLPSLAAVALAGFVALPASAGGPTLYSYPAKENYCPSGLQPVVMGGVICCGQPTTSMTWHEVKRHPVQRARYTARDNCVAGQKGC